MSIALPSSIRDATREAARVGRTWARAPRIPATSDISERRALFVLLFGRPSPERVHDLLDDARPEVMLKIADRFAVTNPLAEALAAARGRPGWSDAWRSAFDTLAERHLAAVVQNRLLVADAALIARELAGQEAKASGEVGPIPHVFLKGTALLLEHPRLAARQTDDIDLLVPPERTSDVAAALTRAGFDVRPSTRMRHPLIARGPHGTLVEIHFELEADLTTPTWRDRRSVLANGTAFSLPSPDALAGHLAHHVLVQHANVPRYLPRHVVDFAELVQNGRAPSRARPEVAASLDLADLALEAAAKNNVATLFGALLFPTIHTSFHRAVARRFEHGFGGLTQELRALAALPWNLWYSADR